MSTRTAETIYTTLVDDIIAGRMAPGAPLVETTLAEQFGVSRTPVREALQRLEQANLAERGARRAVVVRRMAPEDLAELFEAAGEIESGLAALAAQRMSEIERRRLVAVLDEGEGCDDPVVYAEVNARFHDIIKTGARNAMLAATLEDMNLRTLSWRAANFHEDSGRLAASKAEHRAIAEAILAHDAETTRRQMRSHVAAAFMALSDTLSRRG
ncbi:MAG: GntR family transcriptional regulator [Rhodobacteraceae bacterium]|uniref:Transcriptional regulator n=1 Tax=Salipiger profundus TaxID=1229727 RepID=A0A1U7DBN5_9RHOB|nr:MULTISPECIES: GntR family transcriptional regulator [Salipiger]APX25543.1 transcriptional regulator [Salipiger profundus]MAB06235.1 GntR family transcriptional regulator [Paracoccaceae bacterium]GGA04738.1 GntR family transcriptional regulator [Salipiger profundus]SFD70352.1 transcriptional regulator, GntR family [Salipiger profundus]